MSQESDSLRLADPYFLLRTYAHDAKVLSRAYGMNECYYRNMYKLFTYPLVVLSAVGSVMAGFSINTYVLLGLNLSTLLLVGFNAAINPKEKEHNSHTTSSEFGEIKANINQFIQENNKTADDCRSYSQLVLSQITIWKSLAGPCKAKYMDLATKQCARKIRRTHPTLHASQKKRNPNTPESSPRIRLSNIQTNSL